MKFQFMIGGQWMAHPGNIFDHTIQVPRPNDPVMAGLHDVHYRSEQYHMHTDPNNEVLATIQFGEQRAGWIEGNVMPVVWKRKHGAGRVLYSSIGHQASEFNAPEMATILRRGMQWAAR